MIFFNKKPYCQTCYTKRQRINDIGIIHPYPTHRNEPNSKQYGYDKENVVSGYFHFISFPVLFVAYFTVMVSILAAGGPPVPWQAVHLVKVGAVLMVCVSYTGVRVTLTVPLTMELLRVSI